MKTIFFHGKKTFHLDFSGLSVANCLFFLAKNLNVPISRLIAGEPSFFLAKNLIAPNYPTYAWRTVFLPGQESHRSKLSDLCVANCLFPWQKNFPTRLLWLMRGELSFFPCQESHRSKLSDLCVANRLFFS